MNEQNETKQNDNLKKLKQVIPFKWMIKAYDKDRPEATVIPFISADDVQSLLDEVVGPSNWKSEYKEIKGAVYCRLSIKIDGEWVYREASGSSDYKIEKEKSTETSALKRAGKRWGIGWFLDHLPKPVRVKLNEVKTDKNFPSVIDPKTNSKIYSNKLNDFINNFDYITKAIIDLSAGVPLPAVQESEADFFIDIIAEINASDNLDKLRDIYKTHQTVIKENPVIESVFNSKGLTLLLKEASGKLKSAVSKEEINNLVKDYKKLENNEVWTQLLELKYESLRLKHELNQDNGEVTPPLAKAGV